MDVVYLVVGKMTGRLADVGRRRQRSKCGGRSASRFSTSDAPERVTLVAGGIGQTPFLAFARELLGTRGYGGDPPRKRAERVSLYYGVRTADLAAGVEDFRAAGVDVHLASDDGSVGYKGFVTQLLEAARPDRAARGLRPRTDAARRWRRCAAKWGVPCQVSLETPMACGVGICFSCVAKVKTPDGWDYKRVCVDGPAFDDETAGVGDLTACKASSRARVQADFGYS